jgi:hypothetical protein
MTDASAELLAKYAVENYIKEARRPCGRLAPLGWGRDLSGCF